MIYIFGTLGTLLLTYIAVYIDKSKLISKFLGSILKRLFMVLSIMPLAIISAVRYGVGTDYFAYRRIYIMGFSRYDISERGFELLLNTLHKISDDPQIFFAVTSFVICTLYIYMIYKNSINPVYSIFLFVVNFDYFSSMNIIRQALATGIIMLALPYVKTRNLKKMLIIVFIASLFHTSALFFILFYILVTIEWKPSVHFSTILATFVLANLIKIFIFPLLDRFTTYGRFFLETSNYVESNVDWTKFLIYMSFFIFMSYKYSAVRENINLKIMYTAVWVALIIVASGVAMPRNVTRLVYYMNPIIAVYMPNLAKCIPNKQYRFLLNFSIIFCYTAICIFSLNNGGYNALPYQTFWN